MPQNEAFVAGFFSGLVQEIEAKAVSMNTADMFIAKMKLLESANMLKVSNIRVIRKVKLKILEKFIK